MGIKLIIQITQQLFNNNLIELMNSSFRIELPKENHQAMSRTKYLLMLESPLLKSQSSILIFLQCESSAIRLRGSKRTHDDERPYHPRFIGTSRPPIAKHPLGSSRFIALRPLRMKSCNDYPSIRRSDNPTKDKDR